MFTNVFFNPFVGKNYGTKESLFPKKILVLGDSHYCKVECKNRDTCGDKLLHPECQDFTEKTVYEHYLNSECKDPWKRTFSRFINSMYEYPANQEEKKSFFDSIVFYNFLQNAAGQNWNEANNYGHTQNQHLKAFYEVLDEHMPDTVISWGNRLWDILLNDWGYGEAEKPLLSIDNKDFYCCYYYPYRDKTIMLVGTIHPASPKFDKVFHYKLFKKLNLV